jgi:hypothetical protein
MGVARNTVRAEAAVTILARLFVEALKTPISVEDFALETVHKVCSFSFYSRINIA